RPARPRNAVATRGAILASARRAFARAGYDGVGVREIAKGAGVTAMLINRYFGSKERLFAEVMAECMTSPSVLTQKILTSPNPGEALAAALIEQTKAGATPLDGFLITLHSASSKRAAKIGREQIEKHHHNVVTAALSGAMAPQRAAMVLSLIAGFQVMRQMIGLSALAKANPVELVKILGPVFQKLVDGERA
ncbi:MAG TPA: TetR/AcrR family transcriptional regulator, partial [Candidatus Binatus sp.]|nr:TetR/AcrR family transcriptional regulator [Candidatus Binatus sp.]